MMAMMLSATEKCSLELGEKRAGEPALVGGVWELGRASSREWHLNQALKESAW